MPKTPRRGRTSSPSNRSERSEESVPESCFRQFSTGSMSSAGSRGKLVTNRDLREARYEHEAQLEAERHWWLEKTEGQVKELETVFRADFERTSLNFNARIAACQEHFERLLEKEKEERQAALAELTASFAGQRASAHQLQKTDRELQDVRLSIRQTADASSKGIEEVSKTVAESEQSLRLEMRSALAALGAAEGGLRQELCDGLAAVEAKLVLQISERVVAIGQSASKIAQNIDDERDQRVLESNTLRSKLDAVVSQLEMPLKTSATPHSSVSREEVDALSEQIKSLQDSLHEERAKHASGSSEGARHSEQIVTINRLLSALSEQVSSLKAASSAYEKRSAEDLATEGNARAAEALEIRLLAEEALRQAQFAHTTATTAVVASNPPGAHPDAAAVAAAGAEAKVALDGVHAELAVVRRNIQEVEAACRRCEKANGQANASIQELERIAPRVEALEELTRRHATAVMQVEALEVDVRQMSRESDMRRLEAEVRRFNTGLTPLTHRMEAVEEDLRRTMLDTSPLMARMAAIESENKRLIRDNGPMSIHLEALRSDVAAFKSRLLDGQPGMSVQLLAGRSLSLSARSTTPSTSTAPSRGADLLASGNGYAARAQSANAGIRSLEKLPSPSDSAEAPRAETPASSSPPATSSQLQVIQKMQALHQKNLALREGNAELEEILAHEVVRLGRPTAAKGIVTPNPASRAGRLSRSPLLKAGKPVPESPATLSSPMSPGPVNASNQGAAQLSGSVQGLGSTAVPGYGSPSGGGQAGPPPAGPAKLRQIGSPNQQQGLPAKFAAPVPMRVGPTAVPKPYGARR